MWYKGRKKIGGAVFMALLQGSEYELEVRVADCDGKALSGEGVTRVSVTLGDLIKGYGGTGEVSYDYERECWIVPLSEEETFSLSGVVKWQFRCLVNGKPDGTEPKSERILESINKVILSGGGEDA